jgi:hypothetical protein
LALRLAETAAIGRLEPLGIGKAIAARNLGNRGICGTAVQLRAHLVSRMACSATYSMRMAQRHSPA